MPGQARLQQNSTRGSLGATGPVASGGLSAQSRYGNSFLAEKLGQSGPSSVAGPTSDGATTAGATGPTTASPEALLQAPAPELEGGQDLAATGPSTGGAPLQVGNPLPVQAGEQRRTVLGIQIIGANVSPSALDSCEAFVKLTLGHRKDIQERMARAHVALVIIPRDKKMTDVAQFASLKGTATFDGRVWDDVRGSGGTRVAGGLWAIGVPEENLVATGTSTDGYGAGYSVGMHELTHSIQSKGLSGGERRTVSALYAARKKAGGPWTEAYGASNDEEYFAQATNCYFGQNGRVGNNGAEWLRDNDRPMYDFLGTLYGPPPAATQVSGPDTTTAAGTPAAAPATPAHA